MTEQDKANLKEELLELEGMLKACYAKGEGIRQAFGVRFTSLSPSWTADKKPGLLVWCGIEAIAEAFGIDTAGMDQETYRKAAIDAVQQLSVDVGIPTKLEKLKEEDLPFLCESAAADACAPGNPREASLEDFEMMFRKLM